jgi:hypothetical protein
MDRLTIQAEYYNVLKRLRKRSERAMVALAILEFAFDEIEPKELTETAEIAFESMRQSLEKSRNNSGRGGRKKENRFETDLKPICNRNETELQPNENRFETDFFREKNTLPQKERSKEKYTPSPKKETPLYPPKGSGAQDKFFSVYCQFKKFANGEYPKIDFTKLMEEFEKSASLRKTFSWQVILDSYDSIIAGNFRDKVDPQAECREYMADRERYYTALRTAAENQAEKIHKRLMQFDRYAEIDKRLRTIPMEQGKAESKGDKAKMAKLEQEVNRLRQERRGIIEMNGLTEEDIEPRRTCRKCQDTGYDEEGALCDCYKGA